MAFAVSVSVGAVIVLGVVWVFFLLQTIKENAPVVPEAQEVPLFESTGVSE